MAEHKPIIGITTGDINGIGLEIALKTLSDNRIMEFCTPVIYGSSKVVSFHRKASNLPNLNYSQSDSLEKIQPNTLNIINCWNEEVNIQLGIENEIGGKYAAKSLEASINDLSSGKIAALITSPINKHNMPADTFPYKGHTEFFASIANKEPIMILCSEELRVALVSGHVPVAEIAMKVKKDSIVKKLQLLKESLQKDFGIDKPKIAVLGLNPHNGDNGLVGNEEANEIAPAINEAKQKNILAFGPFSSDGFFGTQQFKNYDAVLAMYHDQGLIPFKTIAFNSGVNFTAGLSFIRTSPDHGPA
ncbi:MAG TPA: 4-hydroxythreonine-4-phosphate dehydrogenase PdxA, partial [Bacteroidetes bacterium]|nr:4-hydroxythreonine-4-phosphate dehydrogenase PdxA [Bacteroidota bacterium]